VHCLQATATTMLEEAEDNRPLEGDRFGQPSNWAGRIPQDVSWATVGYRAWKISPSATRCAGIGSELLEFSQIIS
jgi:hypothetical protein